MAYIFVHFTGEGEDGEQVYFSTSRNGLDWEDLGDGPILVSNIGEKGVRDPFLVRNCLNGKFYLLATDLRIANKKGWDTAQYAGSLDLIIWKSDDLVEWSGAHAVNLPYIEELGGGCAWAPESFFCKERNSYMVYWASMIDRKQRIFAAFTQDFHDFTDFRPLIERKDHIIDTTLAEEDGKFYRFSAEEFCGGITEEVLSGLEMNDGEFVCEGHLQGIAGMEGPIIFYIDEINKWCLYADDIRNGAGYIPFLADKLSSGIFERVPDDLFYMGKRKKRHGSILSISEEEYEALVSFYGRY